jgi:hypothetical protein
MPPETLDNLDAKAKTSGYWSADLAPVAAADRTWGLRDIAAFWVALSACIPTYMLASSLIEEGMNWWQAVLTIFLVQGAIVALAGSLLGCALGTWAALAFESWQGVFHVWLGWQLYAAAIAGATAARAARGPTTSPPAFPAATGPSISSPAAAALMTVGR